MQERAAMASIGLLQCLLLQQRCPKYKQTEPTVLSLSLSSAFRLSLSFPSAARRQNFSLAKIPLLSAPSLFLSYRPLRCETLDPPRSHPGKIFLLYFFAFFSCIRFFLFQVFDCGCSMGCGGSKLDDLEAVKLCKERVEYLEAAIRHRYSLSQAHDAYLRSLKSVASSLQGFFEVEQFHSSPPSPFLPLPTRRKGDPDPGPPLDLRSPDLIKPSSSAPTRYSDANSGGSHIDFQSDSDSDGSGSPLHEHETLGPTVTRYYVNYARSSGVPASISYEQRLQSPERVHYGESSSLYSPFPNPSTSYSQNPYSNYSGFNRFFGTAPSYSYPSSPYTAVGRAEPSAKQPASVPSPPPPPPSSGSNWDFFSLFDSSMDHYPTYTPSRDSKELREEEGIPDLEDEDSQHEVVKEVYGEQKFVAAERGFLKGIRKEERRDIGEEVGQGRRSNVAGESSGADYDARVTEKRVVENEKPVGGGNGKVAPVSAREPRGVSVVLSVITQQFFRASESGCEVSKILEVGKRPYCGKNSVYKVSSRMLDVITQLPPGTSLPSNSGNLDALAIADGSANFEENMGMKLNSLSATLEKLYIWEKKLCEEVKVEEKLRIIYERKCTRLKHLHERGAEAIKIEAIRSSIQKLSTKIRISLQFVDSISRKINKLRDEDLWPQIDQLIEGLLVMWKAMLECHRNQSQIIAEAGNLNAVVSGLKASDAHIKATMQLEQDILEWILSFYAWISAQKSYVKAINSWLLKYISYDYEPEITADGIVPFSPGRIGAPPIFVILNHWFQTMERINVKEHEVFESLWAFSDSVYELWEKYNSEQRQRLMADRDLERGHKFQDREEQKMQKALDMANKKLALLSEQNGLPPPEQIGKRGESAGMQSGLKQIFVSMDNFSSFCVDAYEELHLRSEVVSHGEANASFS